MGDIRIFTAADLGTLIAHLRTRGYRVMGPTRRGDAIVTDEIRSIADLPHGVGDTQGPASYRLSERDDGAYFGFAAPAQSSKPVFFPSEEVVWRGRRDHEQGGHFTVERDTLKVSPVALLGVRSCDLRAVQIHDQVLSSRRYKDAHYTARRDGGPHLLAGRTPLGALRRAATRGLARDQIQAATVAPRVRASRCRRDRGRNPAPQLPRLRRLPVGGVAARRHG